MRAKTAENFEPFHRLRRAASYGSGSKRPADSGDREQPMYAIKIDGAVDYAIDLDRCYKSLGRVAMTPLIISDFAKDNVKKYARKPSQTVRLGHRVPTGSGGRTAHSRRTHRPIDSPVNCRRTLSDEPLSERKVLILMAPRILD
jgi:hypothetical protein